MATDVEHKPTRSLGIGRDLLYTACYCEENVYMLCKSLRELGLSAPDVSDLFVVFISNDIKEVPIWRQKNSSRGPDGLCVWDYHVICVQTNTGTSGSSVWDLDTTLPLPVDLNIYVKEAFRPDVTMNKTYSRLFRVVRASAYLDYFASDRRHMRNADGSWRAPAPLYECIKASGGEVHNLEKYNTVTTEEVQDLEDEDLSLKLSHRNGLVLCEADFIRAFGGRGDRAF